MKKSLITLIAPLILVSLVSCGPTNNSEDNTGGLTSEGISTDVVTPDDPNAPDYPTYDEEGVNCKVYYFASPSNCNKSEAYFKAEIGLGRRLPRVDDPISSDPAFNKFIGWSSKPYAMTSDDLWDFSKDHLPTFVNGLEFRLYGQWDYVE